MTSSRHIPGDSNLIYFTVTCHLAPIVADLSQDSDYDPNTARIDAIVTFTPKYKAGEVIHSHTSTPPTGFLALPVTALIDDGYLKLRAKPDAGAAPLPGTLHGLKAKIAADTGRELPVETADVRAALNYAPVRLLGNSASLEIDPEKPLYYDFSFSNIKIDGKPANVSITGGTFEAPWEDTLIDLLDYMPLTPGPNAGPMVVGPQGPQGERGEQGPATIEVGSTTTSASGTEAAVSNSGTTQDMVLDFVIPRGDQGPPGPVPVGVEYVANKGVASGYAPLDGGAKVPAVNLPSYVDDVVEAANLAAFPATGETGKIYVALDSGMTYRWSGSTYIAISDKVTAAGITDSTVVGRAVVTAVDAKAGRAALNAGPEFNVRDYGAKGDGVTDDTAAIQQAIAAADAAALAVDTAPRRTVVVFFPTGLYLTANLTVPSSVLLEGSGATLKAKKGISGYLITFTPGTFGGLHRLKVIGNGAGNTDDLGGVWIQQERKGTSITNCSIERFHGRACLVQGWAWIVNNYMWGLLGDQSDLTTYTGVLEFQTGANDLFVSGNEVNGGRWHPDPAWANPPSADRNMFVCAIVVNDVGNCMFDRNIAELGETGWYVNKAVGIHMSGNRGEFGWGHGYHFVNSSGRIEGCMALDNSKVESGVFDGFHFGAGDVVDNSNFQVTNCVSRSNFGVDGSFAQHRWGVFDISNNPDARNTYANFRSYGDVGQHSVSALTVLRAAGPDFIIPNVNAAYGLAGATPSVAGRTFFRCTASTPITNFLDAVPGQMFYLVGNNAVAVEHNANIVLLSGATTVIPTGQWFVFMKHDGKIVQVDLSSNTLKNKTLRSAKVDTLYDSTNGLAGVEVFPTAGSVNWLRVLPAATTNLRLSAMSSAADANLNLNGRGAGVVQAGAVQVETKGHTHTVAQVTGALSWAAVPASAAAPGTAGQIAYSATGFFYLCVAPNSWVRTQLAAW